MTEPIDRPRCWCNGKDHEAHIVDFRYYGVPRGGDTFVDTATGKVLMYDSPAGRALEAQILRDGAGTHRGSYCVRCLGATQPAELLANDHLCDACAELPWPISMVQLPNDPEVEGSPV